MNPRAFTLMELMIVLAIVGVVFAILIFPNLRNEKLSPAEVASPSTAFTVTRETRGEVNVWVLHDAATGRDYIVVRPNSSNGIAITPRLPATAAEMKP